MADNLRSNFSGGVDDSHLAATLLDRLTAEELYEDPNTWSPEYADWHERQMAKR